uniref:CID domain-containing protein n=1 Tax=Gallus gallus TaxID=9031 RepID=A0A8V0XZV3_CHICK
KSAFIRDTALEQKLSELSNLQQSMQTLRLWLIRHREVAAETYASMRQLPRKIFICGAKATCQKLMRLF